MDKVEMVRGERPVLLHAAYLRFPSWGIVRQMEEEAAAAERASLPWRTRLFAPFDSGGEVLVRAAEDSRHPVRLKRAYYRWLRREAEEADAVLLRYGAADPFLLSFLSRVNKPVFLVHHTLEGPELAGSRRVASRAKVRLEALFGRACRRRSAGIVGVTEEIVEYELARLGKRDVFTAVFPNGVTYQDHLPTEGSLHTGSETPEFVFVASHFSPWHGLDLLLRQMEGSSIPFLLHLVGEMGPELKEQAARDARIVTHGTLETHAIERIMSRCCLALSSFGLFRNNMKEACTLKVREYLRAGVPVYAGHKDVFPSSFPFFKTGPCSVEGMMVYAQAVGGHRRRDVSEAARPFIEKDGLVKKLYEEISGFLREG